MSSGRSERDLKLWEGDREVGKARGAKPLKRLKPKHRQMIALALQGYTNNDIAAAMNLTPSRVSIILNDPLVVEVMNRQNEEFDNELSRLYPLVIDSVKRNLQSGDGKNALRAADLWMKSQGKYKDGDKDGGPVTAEDVAKEVIKVKGEATITRESGTRLTIGDSSNEPSSDQ